ncbi:DUF4190 domain-containing protein [Streptomyces sp. NPDC001480]|uniref:DUF4190 domain-containing protein n=1 Tax=Streptomyces sp. NPDC001480 TaxID=3364577 RepID=UPI0036C234EA
MSDEAPQVPGNTAGPLPGQEAGDPAPPDRHPSASGPGVPLDKPATPDGATAPVPSGAPPTGPGGWAAPASHPGPGDTAVSGAADASAPPFVHDQRTVTSLPGAPPAWAGPFAAPPPVPAPPVAGPPNPFAPPAATGPQPLYAPVPPPPIAPDGPGQLPYGYPAGYGHGYGYGWPGVQAAPDNGMGTAALSLGILAAICFCLWPLAILLGVLAVIFGVIGRGKGRRGEATNGGQALAGIICGAAGIVLGLVMIAVYASTTGP